MKINGSNKKDTLSIGKLLSVILMVFSLTFLTCVNYFLYPVDEPLQELAATAEETESPESIPSPPNPTEEKSPGTGFSIMEEMIHETHFSLELAWFNKLFLHKVAEASKIPIVHFELLSPPPEFI